MDNTINLPVVLEVDKTIANDPVISVGMRRVGGEFDDDARVVVSVERLYSGWEELGSEILSSNFSSNWSVARPRDIGALRTEKDSA